ncbi:MAG: DMT family transporter [Geminicoccaceae bacterium]
MTVVRGNSPGLAIVFIVLAMTCISINDMLIKFLSGDYPLHQMVFLRSALGILFSLVILQFEGGFRLLRTDQGWLHLLRGLCIVGANMAFFAAIAVMPLADATALFFVAPLFITILAIPFLGERVGVRRLGAVGFGFLGVLIMLRPSGLGAETKPDLWILLLPIAAAFGYACMQILTRKLGVASRASAMAIYLQATFIAVSLIFWAIAGDGRFAEGIENKSAIFLLRAWRWPSGDDWWPFLLLGGMSAVIGYALSQAYRLADAAAIAPFEYTALPLSIFWGWVMFGDFPDRWVLSGIAMIAAAGVYVFARERKKSSTIAGARPLRRV